MFWQKKPKIVDADAVAALLERDVLMAWKATDDEAYMQWMNDNGDAALATLRFQTAAAWIFGDLFIQSNKVNPVVAEEVMQKWRIAMFNRVLAFSEAETETAKKDVWEVLFDDIDHAVRIMARVMAEKPPYPTAAFTSAWFKEVMNVNIYKDYDFPGAALLITNSTNNSQIRVHNSFYEHVRGT